MSEAENIPEETKPVLPSWVMQVLGGLDRKRIEEYDASFGSLTDKSSGWSVTVPSADGMFSHTELKELYTLANSLEVFIEIRGACPRLNHPDSPYGKIIAVFHNEIEMARQRPHPMEEDEDEDEEARGP